MSATPTHTGITGRDAMIAFLLMLVATTGLLWLQRLSGAEWVSAMTWTVAVCVLGNAAGIVANGYALATVQKAEATK